MAPYRAQVDVLPLDEIAIRDASMIAELEVRHRCGLGGAFTCKVQRTTTSRKAAGSPLWPNGKA